MIRGQSRLSNLARIFPLCACLAMLVLPAQAQGTTPAQAAAQGPAADPAGTSTGTAKDVPLKDPDRGC